jgi:hypothetical protein
LTGFFLELTLTNSSLDKANILATVGRKAVELSSTKQHEDGRAVEGYQS